APAHYLRKQTLKNAERYTTEALQHFENMVLSSNSKAAAREKYLYEQLIESLHPSVAKLMLLSQALATLDVLLNLTKIAQQYRWCRPVLQETPGISIDSGRHPVLERSLGERFIPNHFHVSPTQSLGLITGPNMGGKSTYMRQNALIVLLAQIGSFVPARSMYFHPIDALFSRIGASDNLGQGLSTFMVEMTETAYILRHASPLSLVLIDEIGRGTSTHDGMALASATCVYLAKHLRAFTLFSTHYAELTQLAQDYPNIQNLHVRAQADGKRLLFLYQVEPGASDRSYGIAVARLAGLPDEVLQMAEQGLQLHTPTPMVSVVPVSVSPCSRCETLQTLPLDTLSPKEALDYLYKAKDALIAIED
ncbi:MAG: DNA mismatch repair protein MutS, partial [Legionellaceae bacterium]|nr:DNA mismatch repair protein MutS [Legionellaceae bacterium]